MDLMAAMSATFCAALVLWKSSCEMYGYRDGSLALDTLLLDETGCCEKQGGGRGRDGKIGSHNSNMFWAGKLGKRKFTAKE